MARFTLAPYDGPITSVEISADTDLDAALKAAIRGRFDEYEVMIADGTDEEIAVWQAVGSHYYDGLVKFVEVLNEDEDLLPAICYAIENNIAYTVSEAVRWADDAMLREGDIENLAYELVDEGIFDKSQYFDYDQLAYDLQIGGDLPEEAYNEDGELVWSEREIKDYAEQLVDDIGVENITGDYVDYEAVARDLQHDYDEFDFGGTTYTVYTSR